jgi:hypothetical protein
MGVQEIQLLDDIAQDYGITRSNLARRLVVAGLLELRSKREA